MSDLVSIFTITQVVISILLIIIVLIQNKNVTLNLSSMGGGMGEVTRRGREKVLHNTTIVLGTLFILNALVLFILR
ncbi:preprotein translocase subunit SecG [Candidatus Gracilibacteria bacterium]|nr:preprotein translocase subunit SecG [Candidatus Gracilibacteria bacterium]